jgi:hypothetical protein
LAQQLQPEVDLRPLASRKGTMQAVPGTQLPPAPVNGSDTCATADALGSVTGAIAYDNTAATIEVGIGQTSFTGGYCNYGCAEYGTGQVAVKRDVWFAWTAPASGRLRVTTCPNQNDTKIALYPGAACPTGTSCLTCNDDYHFSGGVTAGLLDSIVFYNVTAGEQLLIQIGVSSFVPDANPGFAGTFNIDLNPLHANLLDDNLAEANASFFAVGAGHMGINRYADTGDVTTVAGAYVCWGWGGGTAHTNGNATVVALWSDPNGDGNPTDGLLLEQVATTISAANTDTYVLVPFTQNHIINGPYFIGTGYVRQTVGANFPLCIDSTVCEILPDNAWIVGNTALPVDVTNLLANTTPPVAMDGGVCQAQGAFNGLYHGAFAIRPDILVGPPPIGTVECIGDTVAACPCSGAGGSLVPNPGAANNGCGNSAFPAGAHLSATGVAVDNAGDTVILTCNGMPGPGLFFQSNGLAGPFVNFNDGILCAAVGIIRMGVVFPTAGVASYPGGLTPAPIHIAGAPVLTPTPTKHYQCWYRDITPGFCNTQGHNMSNGLAITWAP